MSTESMPSSGGNEEVFEAEYSVRDASASTEDVTEIVNIPDKIESPQEQVIEESPSIFSVASEISADTPNQNSVENIPSEVAPIPTIDPEVEIKKLEIEEQKRKERAAQNVRDKIEYDYTLKVLELEGKAAAEKSKNNDPLSNALNDAIVDATSDLLGRDIPKTNIRSNQEIDAELNQKIAEAQAERDRNIKNL